MTTSLATSMYSSRFVMLLTKKWPTASHSIFVYIPANAMEIQSLKASETRCSSTKGCRAACLSACVASFVDTWTEVVEYNFCSRFLPWHLSDEISAAETIAIDYNQHVIRTPELKSRDILFAPMWRLFLGQQQKLLRILHCSTFFHHEIPGSRQWHTE